VSRTVQYHEEFSGTLLNGGELFLMPPDFPSCFPDLTWLGAG